MQLAFILTLALSLALLTIADPADAAEPAPAWRLSLSSQPTNLAPGGEGTYAVLVTNVGAAPAAGPLNLTVTIADGLSAIATGSCSEIGQLVTCTETGPVPPGRSALFQFGVTVAPSLPDPSTLISRAEISDGGAAATAATLTTTVTASSSAFGFLPGLSGLRASLTEADGSLADRAGIHPYLLSVDLGFASEAAGGVLVGAGNPRNFEVQMPPGLIFDPRGTPLRCREADLQRESCPPASQVGAVTLLTVIAPRLAALPSPVYNMVPPPGSASNLAFDAGGFGFYVHLLGGLGSSPRYQLFSKAGDLLTRSGNPLLAFQLQLWGDPSDPGHDYLRGNCGLNGGACPATYEGTPYLTMPDQCSNSPLIAVRADSWERPGLFAARSSALEGPAGEPLSLRGCAALAFGPRLSLRPDSTAPESPTGLDVDLHLPQQPASAEAASANLRDLAIALPAGLSINPAAAAGLATCAGPQIGLLSAVGELPPHIDAVPPGCPDASKLGLVTLTSPLLDRPLGGGIYLATPRQNPFGTEFALYLSAADPESGVAIKLAGRVDPEPEDGRLHIRFEELPDLPLQEIDLRLFDGPRALLRTPASCGAHSTSALLVPWSDPGGAVTPPVGSFTIDCPGAAAPPPSFAAGTLSPAAAAYSPLLLSFARADRSPPIAGIEARLPPGLIANLRGIEECSEEALAAAAGRDASAEIEAPSCSERALLGAATLAAGAGPAPYRLDSARVYLAGPHQGAPLSLAVVVPLLAGPFDLGTRVIRVALYVDPESARLTARSDPLPLVVAGVPLELRRIELHLDRPDFIRNPTSCEQMSIGATASSGQGAAAPLSERFQLGGCSGLGFKPRLGLRLSGGVGRNAHPTLSLEIATRAVDAGLRAATLALPHGMFIDPARLRESCTRQRFAARRCPPGARLGWAQADTPLLDAPLRGRLYLLESDRRLPDLAVDLAGGRIHLTLLSHLDTRHGRIRAGFPSLPDVPLTDLHFVLKGGFRGLLVNSESLCGAHAPRIPASFIGHNSKRRDISPRAEVQCAP